MAQPGFDGRYAQHIARRWREQLTSDFSQHIPRRGPVFLLGQRAQLLKEFPVVCLINAVTV
jgi:hypothetical protein